MQLLRSNSIAILFIAIISTICSGQEELVEQLSTLRSAGPEQVKEVIDEILVAEPTHDSLRVAMSNGKIVARPDEERKKRLVAGWSSWNAIDEKGVSRPFQLYLPQAVAEGTQPTALIVHMHGAVSRPEFGTGLGSPAATGYGGILWPSVADREHLIIACPQGRSDCTWWTDNGSRHVDAVIRDVRRSLNFPSDAIFGSGFSDGGSGCYYRAMSNPDPFAGFIALNGHPVVAATASGKQVYLPNMAMSATVSGMTQEDSLYPSKSVLPHILTAIQHDANILTISYPNMNHQPTYFEAQTAAIVNFIKTTRRMDRSTIRWYAAEKSIGKHQWVEMLEFVSADEAEELETANVMSTPGRLRMGIQFSPSAPNRIAQVIENSAAANAGFEVGDQLLHFEGTPIKNARSLRPLLAQKQSGDSFTCVVQRGSDEKTLSGQFPAFVSRPVYSREKPTGLANCEIRPTAEIPVIVDTTNVKRIRVWLPPELAKATEIEILVNGGQIRVDVETISNRDLLHEFARRGDPNNIYYAYVDLDASHLSSTSR